MKKLKIEKTKPTFVVKTFKVVYHGCIVYSNSNFFINKIINQIIGVCFNSSNPALLRVIFKVASSLVPCVFTYPSDFLSKYWLSLVFSRIPGDARGASTVYKKRRPFCSNFYESLNLRLKSRTSSFFLR